MDTAEADIVAAPNVGQNTPNSAPCELCGAVLSPGTVCETCALRLLGFALDGATEGSQPGEPALPATPELSAQLYEHFAVCRRPDGSLWELGRGAMGITYRAFDTNLLCPVALKIINGALTGDREMRSRFLREARTAARLRDPHVATVLHLGQSGGDCFYAMEFIEGETVEALLARRHGGLPLETALEIVTQTARALAAAHAENLVHRDIKPANIMLARHGVGDGVHVKIIDFGLAKLAAEDHPAWCDWYFAGTPHYASPEQLEGSTVDARSDVYSLGVVCWHLLAGETAFKAVNAPVVNADGGRRRAVLPAPSGAWLATLPAPVQALLTAMLQPDPAQRPQTAADLLARCLRCRAEVSALADHNAMPAARPNTASQPPRRGHRPRHRLLWLAASVALLGVGCFLVSGKDRYLAALTRWTGHARHTEAMAAFQRGQALMPKTDVASNATAIAAFQDAIRLEPGSAEAHGALARSYVRRAYFFGGGTRDFDLALASAERGVKLAPLSSDNHVALATVHTLRGAQWESLTELHRALELDPHNHSAMMRFGQQWLMLGYPQKALPWLLSGVRGTLKAENLGVALDAYIDLCADELAEKCGAQCEAMEPSRATTYYQMAHLHLLQGNFLRARRDLQDGRAIETEGVLVMTLEAQCELYSGHLPEAEAIFRRLHDGGQFIPITYYGSMSCPSILAYLAYKAGRRGEGDALLKEALALHTKGEDGPQSVYDLAAVRCLEGRPEEALTLLRKSVAAGWLDYRSTLLDPRFETLREEAPFVTLIDALRAKVAVLREEALARANMPLNIADYPVTAPQ